MTDKEAYLKNLTGKDESKAKEAAVYLIDSADLELFAALTERTDFLFPFIRDNVNKRIKNAVNKENFKNVIKFFDIYSSYYDDLFAQILANNANEDITDKMLEILENGSNTQKTYAAKYFSYIPDTVALELLQKYAFCDDENLSINSAEALSEMQDDESYEIALNYLNSEDEWEKLKAVKFLSVYGKNFPLKEIFSALKTSKIPENIAGQIPYAVSLNHLLKTEYKKDVLYTTANIINGLGEILPLSDVFQFELYEIFENLINENKEENANSGIIALILLTAFSKFTMFCENSEYIFDEDKETKNEIKSIFNLLNGQGKPYFEKQKQYMIKDLSSDIDIILMILNQIREYNIAEAQENIRKLLIDSDSEMIICEALVTLKHLNLLRNTDIESVKNRIQNQNIKAVIESLNV